jgi:hypothetical protein
MSCGGGTSGTSTKAEAAESADIADGRKAALAAPLPGPAPADAGTQGMWGPVNDWPLLPIHTVLMPDGRVMSYGSRADGSSTAYFSADLWDNQSAPSAGHVTVSNSTGNDFFCSSQLLLPPTLASSTGRVFIAGGDAWNGSNSTFIGIRGTSLFDSASNSLLRGFDMNQPRWYSSSTTLANGETYVQGGSGGAANPEVRQADGAFRKLTGADTSFLAWSYPRNYVLPDSRLFGYDFEGRMYFVNTAGTGSLAALNILPLQYFGSGSSAMFRPGRILQIGGNTNASAVIDVTGAYPVFTPTQSTSTVRKLANSTLLPDGQVLLTGGSPVWNELQGAARAAEIWNPTTGQWTLRASASRARLYHSSALLLPDASVIVGGGGAPAPEGSAPGGERNVEIYYPPYLFTAAGARASRPVITATPDWLEIGKTFSLRTATGGGSGGVSRVTLVKTGSVTHGWNLDQRFIELTFTSTPTTDGALLAVNSPARPGEATPGYYMLFVFDSAGVPSEARILRMAVAGPVNTQQAPTITNPGDLNATLGAALTRQLSASDPNGDRLTYSAASLPPGLSLNGNTGLITGTPTVAGRHHVVVSASDGSNSSSASFVWTVQPVTPLTLTLTPTPGASLNGGSAVFAAGATGVGVEYAWNFGDGRPTTGWSAQGNASNVFTLPGSYVVTMFVRDSTGNSLSRSFVHTVYLGSPDQPGRASSNLVIEVPPLGPDRLWVVNQDNDSITGFDTVSNARLGEVAVGSAPRSIAVDQQGLLWVTNKLGASISIVDPATRTVLRTLPLPRASQPFGVVMSPVAQQAFVVLEATGQLLRFDTRTFTQTGSLAVGANARQVSITGNGAMLYVTRFITPPLPGEATAVVDVTPTRGGEVLQVDVASMTTVRTVVLAHSNKPDAENQGSGIPNYLGAAAISPDGTQAYVPGKQDNIRRGSLRNGTPLDFQNSVRAISSRIRLTGPSAGSEDLARRVDHDNASLASAAAYERRGVLMFVALETSREVAVIDAHSGAQLTRFDVGRAPQGLVLSSDSYTLYVNNFMDRTVSVHDLRPLLNQGLAVVTPLATLQAVGSERLTPSVLLGKQLFYDARDPRLARDRYMSCATCHNDGGHDGRTWDFTQLGEGVRNTVRLRGRAGVSGGHGRLHWSANFDEVQDFETQIRSLAGGSGLMTDAQLNAGTRAQPLGDPKAGVSADLDALAAYVTSLNSFDPSPLRAADGSLGSDAAAGKTVFQAQCLSCHGTAAFTQSATVGLQNIGTITAASGRRLGGPLTGIDPPTLRDAWATAPYLHDGSAATLQAAISAHNNLTLNATQLAQVAAYVGQIGSEEGDPGSPAPQPPPPLPPPLPPPATGQGLTGNYFSTIDLSGTPVLTRIEAVNFGWGRNSPGAGVPTDNFSVRWTGKIVATSAGSYQFQTESDDGVRLWINGQQVINNWTDHGPTLDTSGSITLAAGQQVDVVMEYYDRSLGAVARLNWRTPGVAAFVPIPATQLLSAAGGGTGPVTGGLLGTYFNGTDLTGTTLLTRVEPIDFDWSIGAPAAGLPADNFSVRWTGKLIVPSSGGYVFQTESDDGVRVWINNQLVIDNWTAHVATLNNSGAISLAAGQVDVRVEYFEATGFSVMRLRWLTPGSLGFVAIPGSQLAR